MSDTYSLLKDFCAACNIELRFNESMSNHTSLRIGGPADISLFPDEAGAAELISMLKKSGIPYIVIGGGTNLLIKDSGIEGAVIFTKRLAGMEMQNSSNSESVRISVQSGCSLQSILNICAEQGLSGMEGLAGIPGSVGGAIAGNAGSFGYEIKDVLVSANLLTPDSIIRRLNADDLGLKYRGSQMPDDSIIISAELLLKRAEPAMIRKKISDFIKEKKSKQPVQLLSAGCVFKNTDTEPAGRLIDEAGCKGLKAGGVEVDTTHANFFVNRGGGTASDYLRLMDMVSRKVKDRFGVILKPEIRVMGRD